MIPDVARAASFADRVVRDLGVALHLATVLVGDRLGLYDAMADGAPVTAADLAERTGVDERFLAEWLAAQAAAGYTEHDGGRFRLPPEHAALLVDGGGPVSAPGAFQLAAAVIASRPAVVEAYRTGRGVGWGEHDPDLFAGYARLLRPGYAAHLVADWLPALDGVVDDLRRGARVADVGCGRGAATLIMARAFPRSVFVGTDPHVPSIEVARRAARAAGLAERATFATAPADGAAGFRLVTTLHCLHGVGDPLGAGRRVRRALDPDGTWMIVEPYAGDRLDDNLTALGAACYSASAMVCVPAARGHGDTCLGAQAGEAGIAEVVRAAGFRRFRRATQTPFSIVYEARP